MAAELHIDTDLMKHHVDLTETRTLAALKEKAEDSIAAAIRHAQDVTTEVKATTITLTITVTPDDKRERFNIQVNGKTALAPHKSFSEDFVGGFDRSDKIAVKALQMGLF